MTVRVEIPMKLPSVANGNKGGHWAVRASRTKAQRKATRLRLIMLHPTRRLAATSMVDGVLVVTLIRVSPRQLDSDNLAYAFKAVRDEVAAYFGVNDNDPRIEWRYAQRKGPACVVLEFDVRTVAAVEPVEARCE